MNDLSQQQQLMELHNGLRALGLRPKSALSSFIERARINGARRTLDAAVEYVRAANALTNELALHQQSKDNLSRSIATGKDIGTILAMDAEERRANLINAREGRLDAEHKAQLRAWEREEELEQARAKRAARTGQHTERPQSQAAGEFNADFKMATDAARARMETEAIIADYLKRHGETPEARATAEDIRGKLERLIRESGLE